MMFGRMRSSSENRRPANRTIPEDAVVIEGDEGYNFHPSCPECGCPYLMYFDGIVYEAGQRYDVWRCHLKYNNGRCCNGKAYVRVAYSDVLWVSPNGKWTIVREEGNFCPNFIVKDDGLYNNKYSMFPDGTYLKENANTPDYVEAAVRRLMDAERKRLGR